MGCALFTTASQTVHTQHRLVCTVNRAAQGAVHLVITCSVHGINDGYELASQGRPSDEHVLEPGTTPLNIISAPWPTVPEGGGDTRA